MEADEFSPTECPVCWETFSDKIYLCSKGHSFCKKCRKFCKICPLCRKRMSYSRNYSLEAVMQTQNVDPVKDEIYNLITNKESKVIHFLTSFTYRLTVSIRNTNREYTLIKSKGNLYKMIVKFNGENEIVVAMETLFEEKKMDWKFDICVRDTLYTVCPSRFNDNKNAEIPVNIPIEKFVRVQDNICVKLSIRKYI